VAPAYPWRRDVRSSERTCYRLRRHLHKASAAHGLIVVAVAGAVLADLGLAGDQRGARVKIRRVGVERQQRKIGLAAASGGTGGAS